MNLKNLLDAYPLATYIPCSKCFKTLSFLHVVNWIKGVIKNDHDDNYIHASKIFANAIFMPPAGCITKQQLLSFNWGPNCSSSNREQRVQFNKGENSSGSNPIIFFLLSLVHSFILFLLPWSRIQISESIYLLRARVVSIHTITLIEFLPFIYRSCKSRCQQKQFLQAEHLFIFIVEEENWDTCFGFSFCKPPPIFFRVYNYIHILLIDWWHLTKKSICKIFANVYQDVFACQTQTGFCFWELAFYWNGMYVQMPDI